MEVVFEAEENPVIMKIKILQLDAQMNCISVHKVEGSSYQFLLEFEEIKRFVRDEL